MNDYRNFLAQRGFAPPTPAAVQAARNPTQLAQALSIVQRLTNQPVFQDAQPAIPVISGPGDMGGGSASLGGVPPVNGNAPVVQPGSQADVPQFNQNDVLAWLQAQAASRPPVQPPANPIPDVTNGQGQGAGPASLAATQPTVNPGGASILDDVGNAVGSVPGAAVQAGQAIGDYSVDRAKKIAVATNAAMTAQQPANESGLASTINTGTAPIGAVGSVLGPDIVNAAGMGAGVVGKNVVDPVASAISQGYDATWGSLTPEQKQQAWMSVGITDVPSQDQLKEYAGKFLESFNYPQQNIGAPFIGYLFYQIANDQGQMGGLGAFLDQDTKDQIIAAYQKGGGKGVWEDWVANGADFVKDQGLFGQVAYILYQAGIDIASDPLTWTPLLGEYLKGVGEASAAADIGAGGSGITAGSVIPTIAGHLVNAPNELADVVVDAAGNAVRGIGKIGRMDPGAEAGEVSRLQKARIAVANQVVPDTAASDTASDVMNSLGSYRNNPTGGGEDIGGSTGVPASPNNPPPPTAEDVAANVAAGTPPGGGSKVVSNLPNGMVVYQETNADGSAVYRVRTKNGDFVSQAVTPAAAVADIPPGSLGDATAPGVGPLSGSESTQPGVLDLPQNPGAGPISGAESTQPGELNLPPTQDVGPLSGAEAVPPGPVSDNAVTGGTPDLGAPTTADGTPLTVDEAGNVVEDTTGSSDIGGSIPDESPDLPEQPGAPIEPGLRTPSPDDLASRPIDITPVETPPEPAMVAKADALIDKHIAPIQAVDPAIAAAVKAEVETELRAISDRMGLPGRWGIDKQLDNAEAGALVRDAARRQGVDLPAEAISREADIQLPERATSREARMQRVLFTPDETAVKGDREFLYKRRDIQKTPPAASTAQHIMQADLPRGGYVINDAVYLDPRIPDGLKAALSSDDRKLFDEPVRRVNGQTVKGQFIGRQLTNADLAPLTEAERSTVADVVMEQQQTAYDRYTALQEHRSGLHGSAPRPRSESGIVPRSFHQVESIKQGFKDWATPYIPKALEDEAPRRVYAPAIEARVQTGNLTPYEAETLSTQLPIKGGRISADGVKPMESIADRFDYYQAMEGMSPRDAMFQTTKDAIDYLHPSQFDKNGFGKLLHKYDTANRIVQENIRYNTMSAPKAIVGNYAGDGVTMIVTGHGGALKRGWGDISEIYSAARDMDTQRLNDIRSLSIMHETGQAVPAQLTNSQWKKVFDEKGRIIPGKDTTQLSLVRTVDEHMGETAGRIAKFPAFFIQDKYSAMFQNALDLQRRLGVFTDQFTKDALAGSARFDVNLARTAAKEGATADAWREAIQNEAKARMQSIGEGDLYHGLFSPDDVRVATGSEDLARKWQQFLKDTVKKADAEQKRVLFSGETSALDKKLSRAVYFHYWTTRALALHTETALRNPFLMALYVRTFDGLEHMAKENGYPPGAKGLMEYFKSAQGMSFFFNPAGIAVPYMMLSQIGNSNLPFYKRLGAFLAPFMEGGLAAMGMTDNVPDWTGTSAIRGFAQAVLNSLDAHGYSIPGAVNADGKLNEDWLTNLQQTIYQEANRAAQAMHITSKDYQPYNHDAAEVAQIKAVIVQNAIDQWGPQSGWTPDESNQVIKAQLAVPQQMLSDPLSKAAYMTVADAQLENKALSTVIPGGSIVKYDPLEANRALNNAIPYGTDPSTLTPEQIAAQQAMGIVNAGTTPGMTSNTNTTTDLGLQTQADAYANLGSERERALYEIYNDILYGDPADLGDQGIEINGSVYQFSDILAMNDADRQKVANAFIDDQDGQAELDDYTKKRTAFLSANPQFSDFKTYQKAVYADPGGARGWRLNYAKTNPNFQAKMDAQEAIIKRDTKSNFLVQKALDQWASGRGGYEAANGIADSLYAPSPENLLNTSTVAAPINGTTGGSSSSPSSGGSSSKTSTVDRLTQDIAQYQQDSAVLNDALAQAGMPGGIQNYTANKYTATYIKNVFGDLLPTKSSLENQYDDWVQAQPPYADTSPTAFATYYDAINPPDDGTTKVAGYSASKSKLYQAWKAHQPQGANTSPAAFDAYLSRLSTQTVPGMPTAGAYAP